MNDPYHRNPTAPLPSFVLLTDAPPLKNGGHGCHILAWNWIEAMEDAVKLVVTHRLNHALSREKIANDLRVPVYFYGDLSGINFPRCLGMVKSMLEVLLFIFYLLRLSRRIRASGAKRLFAFFGGNPWFLCMAVLTARRTKLPLDVYLVDDLEESARQDGQGLVAHLTRWLERRTLQRANRVFAISQGFCEHLEKKYHVRARWLPIAIPQTKFAYRPYGRTTPDVREIAFIGAVNRLYLDPLKTLLQIIDRWNQTTRSFQLRLLLMTYTDPGYIVQELGRSAALDLVFRPSPDELSRRLGESWAIFLPYSFAKRMRLMVNTSFPTKLVESFTAGRPILVCGPSYASVPRYFHENNLPLCAGSVAELETALREIERHDNLRLIEQYEGVVRRFHSLLSIRNVLRV